MILIDCLIGWLYLYDGDVYPFSPEDVEGQDGQELQK